MNAPTAALVRRCPNCGTERPVVELACEHLCDDGKECGYDLADEAVVPAGSLIATSAVASRVGNGLVCTNGHPMEEGDQFCLECGAEAVASSSTPAASPEPSVSDEAVTVETASVTVIEGWRVLERLPLPETAPWERFLAEPDAGGARALFTLYQEGSEPDPDVYDALRRLPAAHIPALLATGRHEGRAFDVVEWIGGGSLADASQSRNLGPEMVRPLVEELGRALADFAEVGLRHRDIRPKTVLTRSKEPLDLVVTGFGSARLSDFDLEAVAPLKLTRYSAPEAIVGAVSAASDWWSLGMIALECATRGACFEGVHDQAFRIHVVTRGVEIPTDLGPDIRLLLRGLLARDPLLRWTWTEVRAWLAGEAVEAPEAAGSGPGDRTGPPITLAGREYWRPEAFVLAAAEEANWAEARGTVLRGAFAHWLEERGVDARVVAEVRRIAGDAELGEDARHALVLMAANRELPLVLSGEIVTPAWLLAHPDRGYDLLMGGVTRALERIGRESWLVRLRTRAEAVRERARLLEIELDEARVRVALLATSRANLEAERERLRALFPDTEHNGLASILERSRLSDEDLVILVGASISQFTPLAPLVEASTVLASRTGVAIDPEALPGLLSRSRREVFAAVDERVANFARCGIPRVDEWADTFRIERRMALPRAAVLLSVPPESWAEPPRQQYVANLLEHFEKRVSSTVGRGPLVRFLIGKTTPRVDLMELGTAGRSGDALVNHLIGRTDVPVTLDPSGYMSDMTIANRLRRLVNNAAAFRRDTGIDGRYLGFPFLLSRDGRSTSSTAHPRIAPVLLWPVTLDMPPGWSAGARIAFDRERDEVRLNPALESIVGATEFARWKAARDDVLARPSPRVSDVMDVLAHLAPPIGRSLSRVPGKDVRLNPGALALAPAAALFNAEFTGQAVAEDLRGIRGKPLAGTALEAALRVSDIPRAEEVPPASERDRYLTVESDPSQEDAVHRSRHAPGLLVEGPPGTGKSQTIVNIVANAIGHGETVLVVCQKQAALQVVRKRLDAEGLGERLFTVVDINRDRTEVVTALRAQTEAVFSVSGNRAVALRRQRDERAGRIEALEQEVDRHHEAYEAVDDVTGLSYRSVLADLIGLEAAGPTIPAVRLRPIVGRLGAGALSSIEEACGPLARTWLASHYERSRLSMLKAFAVDDGTEDLLSSDLGRFLEAEANRSAVVGRTESGFETDSPESVRAWMATEGAAVGRLDDGARHRLAGWFDLFRDTAGGNAAGDPLIAKLEDLLSRVAALEGGDHDSDVFERLLPKSDADLTAAVSDLRGWAEDAGFFAYLNPGCWMRWRRVRAFAKEVGVPAEDARLAKLRRTIELELALRPLRAIFSSARTALGLKGGDVTPDVEELRRGAAGLLEELRAARASALGLLACPAEDLAVGAAKASTIEAYASLRARLEGACARHDARERSRTALAALSEWIEDEFLQSWAARLTRGEATSTIVDDILAGLGAIKPYQLFRARAASLPETALAVFATLRDLEGQLEAVAASDLEGVVRRTIRREALLATKGRLETAHPELLYERGELESRVSHLARLDAEMRELNKQVLAGDLERSRLGTKAQWDDITRLRGPKVRRLREIMDAGPDIGLMHLRPVWLMNPDVASRVLPLRPGLFDLVIYDEASQMPVEHAVPTLFRAKRAVISGDEKQMPPSSFFSAAVEADEDDVPDDTDVDDGATEAERIALEESWNRREVKDCPDLLQLGRSSMPVRTLQIHYRSKYRELIGFSNAAFYGGTLSVPAKHPEDEIRRALPIEVVRVDGVYAHQTNEAEADRIVELLACYWSRAEADVPTIGVVTFNRKQADLIEDAIERRAAEDEDFLRVLRRERDRVIGGEDMGFFVKNVENVQGDERDVIVFSTTFGRDARGTFRRNFGVLGVAGGERRLNVAVTRAKEKVILVTSMPVSDVSDWLQSGRPLAKPRDYLQAYLDHAAKLHACEFRAVRTSAERMVRRPVARTPSAANDTDSFIEAVARYLGELGYDPVSAHESGDAFSMDFAVVDPRTGLFGIGIDCDAPSHPLLARARAREIWRGGVIARAIPALHRVSSRDWYHHPDEEKARLRDALLAAIGERDVA